MSQKCNGYKDSREECGVLSTEFVDIATANSQENIETETTFRGFEKPEVVTRYKLYSDGNEFVSSKGQCYLPDIIRNCTVKLMRDDLEQLKMDILQNSRVNQTWEIVSNGNISMPKLKCKICEKAYNSEKKLQKHQANKHMLVYKAENNKPQKRVSFSDHIIIHEVKEYHRCRKCTRIFEDYRSLKSHMKQKHKKRKCYICNYCDKNFIDRMFFKVHIKLHCDVCGLLLPNKTQYNDHRRNVCRVLKKYKCKTCHEAFFRFMDLKDHSYEHLEKLFICDICKEQFDSRCAVSHHIAYLHSEKRPRASYTMRNIGKERLYLCNFCEESSVDREMIEKHVAALPDLKNKAMTGYKDYYFCDQCLMKFETETSMVQHKWSHFLKTCDNSQLQQKSILSKPQHDLKRTYKVYEKLPDYLQPRIIIERMEMDDYFNSPAEYVKCNLLENVNIKKKAIVDPKSKKTLLSRYQCEKCNKYYSTNYCLNRHIVTVHDDYANLRCNVCNETFIWPSLLQTHNCNPQYNQEVQYENYQDFGVNAFDELMNISASEDYMNTVDFEIPAPVVELTEYENCNGNGLMTQNEYDMPVQSVGYKIVMQEVPIEF